MEIKQVAGWWFPAQDAYFNDLHDFRGEYQKMHRSTSLRFVRGFRTALDVGGHVGLWSRDLSLMFARVIAFEPLEINRRCFRRNVDLTNVDLVEAAVGAGPGTISIVASEANTGISHIGGSGQGNIEVRMIAIDSLNLSDVDYIKIDTEGYELHVLEGARETLLRCKPVVTIEQKKNSEEHFQIPRYQASEFLTSLGAKAVARVVDDVIFAW